jgi:hippurate hydrolase
MPILDHIAAFHDEMAAWRRHLHQNPELGFEEHETAAFVAEKLKSFGVDEVHTGIAGTGVVGVLRAGAGKRSVGLRADLDALPIREETGLPWASRADGKMHACGHDGHTAMLLGAARYLAETRNFDGTVYLIFQPAEEVGGGERVVAAGLFERFPAERVFGLHNRPQLPVGRFAMRAGPAYAGCDDFTIRLEGQGCHAGWPHLGRDPIVAGAQLVLALQTLVARQVDPLDQAVVSVTRHVGGDAHNVIPGTVELWGTVRAYRPETRDFLRRRLAEVTEGVAVASGVGASLSYVSSLPPLVNGREDATFSADVAAEVVGEAGVDRDPPPVMSAEDFAFMLQAKPGAFVWMGIGRAEEGRLIHTPLYDFNDEALPYGASYWTRLAERFLAQCPEAPEGMP